MPESIEPELALILREAITNVIRHANTNKVWVNLTINNKEIKLEIKDSGSMANMQVSSGMQNMKSRIEKVGGTMAVVYKPSTALHFNIPTKGS